MKHKFLLNAGLMLVFSSVALAGRPLETSDAGAVDRGTWEVEGAVGFEHDPGSNALEVPFAITYGLIENVEVGLGIGYDFTRTNIEAGGHDWDSAWEDVELSAKWKILSQDQYVIDQGLAFALSAPIGDEDRHIDDGDIDYDFTWIGVRNINDKWAILANVGYTFVAGSGRASSELEGNASDVIHYSLATTYQWTDTLQPVAEVVFETPIEGGSTAAGVNAGLRWQVQDHLTIDFALGTHLHGDWPDWTATSGFTWDF